MIGCRKPAVVLVVPKSFSYAQKKYSPTAEYALDGLSNNIFASRYVLYIPNKEQFVAQVEAVLNKWHRIHRKIAVNNHKAIRRIA